MGRFASSAAVVIIFASLISLGYSGSREVSNGDYVFDWSIASGNITVTAVVRTTGYIGFGISPYGSMMEADIIFAGHRSGAGYVQDSYAFADTAPVRDRTQNVEVLSSSENSTHTTVTFRRQLDTRDVAEDQPIVDATQFVIWSWGPTDNFQYHGPNRGNISVNLVSSA